MLLIGMLDSPFVRRVAISMLRLGLAYEHGNWSVGRDFDKIRQYNPLGRVPTLVLDDGVVLAESSAILDYLDDLVGAERALLPPSGRQRREALQLMWLAAGAAEKGRDQVYEQMFRPPAKQYPPWRERLHQQMLGGLTLLEHRVQQRGPERWLIDERITQADITVACALTFIDECVGNGAGLASYPGLRAFAARCEVLPEFRSTYTPWFAPTPPAS